MSVESRQDVAGGGRTSQQRLGISSRIHALTVRQCNISALVSIESLSTPVARPVSASCHMVVGFPRKPSVSP